MTDNEAKLFELRKRQECITDLQKKLKAEHAKFNEITESFNETHLSCSNFIKKESEKLINEYSQSIKDSQLISTKIRDVQQSINELNTSLQSSRKEAVLRQETLKSETENLISEKSKEIQALYQKIDYYSTVNDFYKRLSGIEILETTPTLKVRVKVLKDEHIFSLENYGKYTKYSVISFTQTAELVPDFLKEEITFKKEQFPKLFLNIIEYMQNNI